MDVWGWGLKDKWVTIDEAGALKEVGRSQLCEFPWIFTSSFFKNKKFIYVCVCARILYIYVCVYY